MVVCIDGVLEGLEVHDADTGLAEARIALADGGELVAVGELDGLTVGTPLRMVGTWHDQRGGGRRLQVADYQVGTPDTLEGIARLLAGLVPRFGSFRIQRVLRAFGQGALTVIETSPGRLLEATGVGAVWASRLAAAYAEHRHVQDVTAFLRGQGVSAGWVSRMVRRHGGDVVWLPSPPSLVDVMMDLARVTADDHVLDLGAGDGPTVIAAARRGAYAVGGESNPELIEAAKRKAAEAGVAERTSFVQADLFAADLGAATVITLFLSPSVNFKLRPRLLELRPGTRIVSNTWAMADWPADAEVTVDDDNDHGWRTVRLWIVPAQVAGRWRGADGELVLDQSFQLVSGTLTDGPDGWPIVDGRMQGTELELVAGGAAYRARLTGDELVGTVTRGDVVGPWHVTRSVPERE